MDWDLFKITLAALFHDIGKFAQRTNIATTKEVGRNIQEDLKYSHAYFTSFVLSHILISDFGNFINLVSRHHNPHSNLE